MSVTCLEIKKKYFKTLNQVVSSLIRIRNEKDKNLLYSEQITAISSWPSSADFPNFESNKWNGLANHKLR